MPNIDLKLDRLDFDAGLVDTPGSCNASTDVGGLVTREMLFDGVANGAVGMTFTNSALLTSFGVPNYGGHVSPAADPWVGGFPYSGVGAERKPLRTDEVGLGGVSVTVYGDGNAVLGTTTTDSLGRWSITPSGGPAVGTPVLVEWSGWPSWMSPGPHGADNEGAVRVADVGECDVDFTVGNPADNCTNNPDVTLSCFVGPDGVAGLPGNPTDTIVDLPYQEGDPYVRTHGDPLAGSPAHDAGSYSVWADYFPSQPSKSMRAAWTDTGNVGGLAWDAKRGVVYSATHYKVGAPIGSDGLGAIFRDDTLWLDLAAAPLNLTVDFGLVCSGSRCKNDVGFMGLGDIDMDDDWNTVYTVNLATQEIVAIPILANGNPDTANVRLYAAPAPAQCNANAGSFDRSRAPYGLVFHEDRLYVGVTCANASSSSAGPHGFVYSFDSSQPTATYTLEASIDLSYTKYYDDWSAWVNPFGSSPPFNLNPFSTDGYVRATMDDWGIQNRAYAAIPSCNHTSSTNCALNQPWVVDLEFDVRADGQDHLIMGVRNRVGDIWESAGGHNGGDVIRFCETAAGSNNWTAETMGTGACGDLTPSQRHDPPYASNAPWFYDTHGAEGRFTTGALAQVPGFTELVTMGVDNMAPQSHSGVSWMDNNRGDHSRASTLLGAVTGMRELHKIVNWGDVEVMCPAADFIVGDTLWFDSVIENGLRDPSELPVVGATVELYVDSNGNGVLDPGEDSSAFATVVTDANGNFAFSRSAHSLAYDSNYIVAIAASNFTSGPLVGFEAATANNPASDTRDSDGVLGGTSGLIEVPVTTGGPGQSVHDIDFGFDPLPSFYDLAVRVTPVSPTAPAGSDVNFTIELINQGTLDASNIQVRQFVLAGDYQAFSLVDNPAGTTGGGASLSYSWATSGLHGIVTVSGTLTASTTVTIPVTLSLDASAAGDVATWAEVHVDDGSDTDSQPESEEADNNGDVLVDDEVANAGGDEDDHDIAFVAVQNGTIGDYVWFDANRDGVQGGSESGLSGVTLRLYRDDGDDVFNAGSDTLVGTTVSDHSGAYVFNSLSADDYFVDPDETTLPAGFAATTGTPAVTGLIVLPTNGTYLKADFGYAPSGGSSIGDFIWVDENDDGTADVGEVGIPGVLVTVTGPGGYSQSDTTGPDGYYLVTGVTQDGEYLVTVDTNTLPAGLDPQPTGYASASVDFPVIAGEDMLFADFGFNGPSLGVIGDTVYLDVNGNGSQQIGEPGLVSISVDLLNAGLERVATMETDGNGNYAFRGLLPGTYTVEVTDTRNLLNGFVLTGGVNPTAPIALASGQAYLDADFGYDPGSAFGVIGNFLWHDLNGDGVHQTGEPGIERVFLQLWQDVNDNSILEVAIDKYVRKTRTDKNGNYLFTKVPFGNYLVTIADEEYVLTDLSQTLGSAGVDQNSQVDPYKAIILSGRATSDLRADFGFNTPPPEYNISGTVFFDVDNDATWEPPNESGIGEATVSLYRDQNSNQLMDPEDPLFGTVQSAANGFYQFVDLPANSDWIVTADTVGTFLEGAFQSTQQPTGIEPVAITNADSPNHNFGYWRPENAALVASFEARQAGAHVQVEWQTTSELGTVGFWLYRLTDTGWQQVHDNFLPALVGEPQGGTYRLVDPSASSGVENTYYLLEIEVDGRERWHGPYTVVADRSANVHVQGFSAEAAAHTGRDLVRRNLVRDGGLPVVQRAAAGPADRVRALVEEAGAQRITAAQLAAQFGLRQAEIEQRLATGQLDVRHAGQQVSWWTDGKVLEFYAPEETTRWSPQAVYLVHLAQGSTIQSHSSTAPPIGAAATFEHTTHLEQNVFAATAAARDVDEELWFWSALVGGNSTAGIRAYDFDLPELQSTSRAILEVRVSGATAAAAQVDHAATFRINGAVTGSVAWNGSGYRSFAVPFDGAVLAESNTFEIVAELPQGVAQSVFYLDSFSVTHFRGAATSSGDLEVVTRDAGAISVEGVGKVGVTVLDTTDPFRPVRLSGVALDTGLDRVAWNGVAGSERYFVWVPAAAKSPTLEPSYALDATEAEYLVFAPSALHAGAQRLVDYRRSLGFATRLVEVEQVFDAFGDGERNPAAIHAFLTEAYRDWTVKPRWAVMLGKGTLDAQDYRGLGDNLLPTTLVSTPQGVYGSDMSFGDVSGNDGVPEIAIGRIPVVTPQELEDYLDKMEIAESTPASDRVILAADDPDLAGDYPLDTSELGTLVPSAYQIDTIDLSTTAIGQARSDLQQSLASGAWLLNYQGHGGLGQFAAEGLLIRDDVATLPTGGALPIVASMTCSAGRFELPGVSSLGERLVLEPDRGAIAILAPSGLSVHDGAKLLDRELVLAMLDEPTLGDAVVRALAEVEDEIPFPYLLRIYNLLGDPAMPLEALGGSPEGLFLDGVRVGRLGCVVERCRRVAGR